MQRDRSPGESGLYCSLEQRASAGVQKYYLPIIHVFSSDLNHAQIATSFGIVGSADTQVEQKPLTLLAGTSHPQGAIHSQAHDVDVRPSEGLLFYTCAGVHFCVKAADKLIVQLEREGVGLYLIGTCRNDSAPSGQASSDLVRIVLAFPCHGQGNSVGNRCSF